ncbi:MAG: hemolysin family protein [Brevinematia bacterium]
MTWLFSTFIFIFISALFSGFETAFVGIDRIWLHSQLEKNNKRVRILNFLLKHSENTIGTFLFGTNLADVATVISFIKFLEAMGMKQNLITITSTVILTPVILLFSTFIPKLIFREYSNEICSILSYFFLLIYILFFPFQIISVSTGKIFMKIFRVKKKEVFSREDFNIILKSYESHLLKENEKEFIERIMNLKQVKAKEIMVPLVRMSCVEESEPVKVAIALMGATGLTRLPVFRMRVDNMVGYIETKDLISAGKNLVVSKFCRKGIFVSEFTPIYDILFKMKKENTQMVFVVDEYGGVSGIITNQEIIKELLGEFQKKKEELIHKEKDYWIANGMLSIEELNEELNINIPHIEFETLAGYLLYQFKKIPSENEKLEVKNYVFEIISVSQTRIKQVKIYKKRRGFIKWKN